MSARLALKYLFISFFVFSMFYCKKAENGPETKQETIKQILISGTDSFKVFNRAEKVLGSKVFYYNYDYLTDTLNKSLLTISTNENGKYLYGIIFSVFKVGEDTLYLQYSTNALDGITDMSKYGVIEIDSKRYGYYNSFISSYGSGGGEIEVYLFNPVDFSIYSAKYEFDASISKTVYSENLKKKQNDNIKRWMIKEIEKVITNNNNNR